jgi:pimeloyl-ACP methyl ester carboxylesterase
MPGFRRVAAAAGAVIGAGAVARYWHDLRLDQSQLATIDRQVIETPFGRVEYAQAGDGPPILVVHGVLGGCDFGVGAGRANVPPDYRIISPSRFGFLGSPLPADPSPPAQADAFARLLDHLEIAQLPVLAFSAGSSSAIQLALRHPSRVSRLVLISPNSPHAEPLPKPPRALAPLIFSQPVFWAMRVIMPARFQAMTGTPPEFVPNQREQAELQAIVNSLFPVGPRARGTIYDSYIGNLAIATYPFETLAVPTLIVAAEDDTLAPYNDTRAMADRIPDARFVSVPRGGHTLTYLDPRVPTAVAQFLTA